MERGHNCAMISGDAKGLTETPATPLLWLFMGES